MPFKRSLWTIKDTVLLHWQTVTNHVGFVSWLEGGANGKEKLGKGGGENYFRELSCCLFPLSHSGAAYSQCHQ